jgi:hypothetical protein
MTKTRKPSLQSRAIALGKRIDDAVRLALDTDESSMFDIKRQFEQDWRELNASGAKIIHALVLEDHAAWHTLDDRIGAGKSGMTFAWVARQYRNQFRPHMR